MRVGDVIGERFLLERLAGAGGMGVVFRARDLLHDVPVALKCVAGTAHELERFAREAAVLAGVEHPRVVRHIDHGLAGGSRWLAMEWLDGEDLAHRLARGPLDASEVAELARGVAEALAVLHARGIVHRDIKPSNVFLVDGRCDAVKLLDLGVARDLEHAWNLTGTGVAIGTPAYMAPEQARGEPVDARADLFSLGCLLFECLAGRPPFRAEHPIAALAKLLLEEAPRLDELGVVAPPALDALVARLLAKDRAARPASATHVLAALDAPGRLTPAPPPPATAAITAAEQRIVSVALTRPTGAATSDTLLPQESGDLERRVRAVAAAHGAQLERLPGGSFLALFTGAGVPTDHAARGAAFALALVALLGTDTIALVTGRGQLRERVPVGAVIERAVALLDLGGAGVQLDAVTAGLLEDRFEILIDGQRRQLLGERDIREPRRTLLGRVTACVGRERELAALSAALATCIEEPVASAVLITAPPGTGKSRIVDEFVRSARGRPDVARVLVGSCDVMSAGSAFGALGRALRRPPELLGDLTSRLRARMSAREAAWTAELLGDLCGLVRGDQASENLRRLRSDPVLLGDALAEAFRALVARETDEGALVLVLEDLHWGDLPSLRLIDGALRVLADRPLYVLATARPEIHELFPRLWAERGVQEIRLGTLTRKSAERLARQVLGPDASATAVAQVVERAGGHPFLLEELLRTAAQGASLAGEIPDTVLGVLQARFDALDEDARAALRAASVFGASFWLAGVSTLLGAEPPPSPEPAASRHVAAERLPATSDGRDDRTLVATAVRPAIPPDASREQTVSDGSARRGPPDRTAADPPPAAAGPGEQPARALSARPAPPADAPREQTVSDNSARRSPPDRTLADPTSAADASCEQSSFALSARPAPPAAATAGPPAADASREPPAPRRSSDLSSYWIPHERTSGPPPAAGGPGGLDTSARPPPFADASREQSGPPDISDRRTALDRSAAPRPSTDLTPRRRSALAATLDGLVAAEFIEPRADSKLPGQREYAFRHALVREAAYATLVDADRATGHRLAAAWLEAVGEHDALVLAEHFARGGDPVRAARWLRRAAEDALEGNDLDGATRLAERAVTCDPDDTTAGAALLVLADAHYWRGDMAAAQGAADRAALRFPAGTDPWYAALGAAIQAAGQRGANDQVEACMVRALQAEGPASDARLICVSRGTCQLAYVSYVRAAPYKQRLEALAAAADPGPLARGWIERVRVETTPHYRILSDSAAGFARARASFEAAGALRYAGLVRIFQCRSLSHTGRAAEALHELEQVTADIERLGVPYLRYFASMERGVVRFYLDQDEASLAELDSQPEVVKTSRRMSAIVSLYRALIILDRGDPAAAAAHVQSLCDSELAAAIRATAFAVRARAEHRLGRPAEALAAAEAALALRAQAQPDVFDELPAIAAGEVLLAAGDEARAREAVAAAWSSLQALPIPEPARERLYGRRIIRDLAALARRLGLHPAA